MSAHWKFRRRQGMCSACGRAFQAGEALFSLLRFDGQELARGDLCTACFDARDPAEDLSYWRTLHRPGAAGGLRVDFDWLLATAQRLAADPRPAARDFAFLVTLLLVRHRRLRLLSVLRRDGVEVLNLRKLRAQEGFEVEVRDLDPQRRAQLTAVLAELLDPAQEADLDSLLAQGLVPATPPADEG
ncbi:MAG: hypothetical protein EYC70_14635 [Planctomycetota bacterium]|nr:MAG: hypothetical protein EYC70_14635 [Planctomycetota bacterium]